jgi:alkyl hydroperoxide reductase subunit AhpF
MPLIGAADAAKVKSFFDENLENPVTIELFTEKKLPIFVPGRRECEYCEETEQLLGEVAAISDKIQVNVHDLRANPDAGSQFDITNAMVPAIVLRGAGRGTSRFFGIPAGYEFTSLLQDLVDESTGTTKLAEATRTSLAGLTEDVHIRVFVTPT